MNYNTLLAISNIFGDTDIAQTYIQFLGFLLGILTLIGLIVTLNLQRIALIEQTKVNEIQSKVALKEITPLISLHTTPKIITGSPCQGEVIISIKEASCNVYSYGFIYLHNYFSRHDDILSLAAPLPVGNHHLMSLAFSPNIVKASIYRSEIQRECGIYIEIVYGDVYQIAKYKAIYELTDFHSNRPLLVLQSNKLV